MNSEQVQRRTIRTLMTANAFGYAGFVAVVAVSALLASEMLGSDSIAGVPAAAATLGTAVAAAPLAQRSMRMGRRRGIWVGYAAGMAGGAMAFVAGQSGLFWLLVFAMVAVGVGNTSNLQNRFAAADLAQEGSRARAISMVVWVGTIGAVIGTPAALWANRVGESVGVARWASPMLLGVVGFGVAGLVIEGLLRPDPLELAGGVDSTARRENPIKGAGRSLRLVWPNFDARLAIIAMAVGQMAMVAVMTMTPLYMKDHGHAELSIVVIAVHVLGMFGLSPLIGGWADRFGRVRAVQVGAIILGAGTVTAVIAGYSPVLVFIGLFLLGLGWSVAIIAGSALLTESLPESERVPAQGLADVTMSLVGAAAAFSSGFVKEIVGYHWLANFATFAAILLLIGASWIRSRQVAVVVG
ncbi:MAG: MFS transporter [Actinomycetota bacterium]|nr:MFS transporter [Actinomycetota bacterium]